MHGDASSAVRASSRSRGSSQDGPPALHLSDHGADLLIPSQVAAMKRPRAGTMPSAIGSVRPELMRRQLSGASVKADAASGNGGDGAGAVGSGTVLLAPPGHHHTRFRSGSLTLPASGGVGQAFGPNVFSRSWTPTDNSGQPSPAIPEEVRSPASDEEGQEVAASLTLDYLGLVTPQASPTAAHMNSPSIDAQLQSLQARNMADSPGRLRANTVAAFARNANAAAATSLTLSNGMAAVADTRVPRSTPALANGSAAVGGIASSRPRAATIGLYQEDPNNRPQRTPSTAASMPQADLGIGSSAHVLAMSRESSSSHTPEMGSEALHEGSPEWISADLNGSNAIIPSRTLWVGNLDSRTGAQELTETFSPYGAIESVRVLAEKDCAFVNFVTLQSAITARDDIMKRLGGQITRTPGIAVRIGFGRAEGSPQVPLTSAVMPPGHIADSQSMPSRALWVGSTPPNATQSDLLHVFGQWGPIESARVLTHKSCAFVNFERLDDAVRARKALNGREIFGSENGQVKVGFARVPIKQPGAADGGLLPQKYPPSAIAASARVKGASAVPPEHQQQMLQGMGPVHDYRSSLLLSMVTGNTEPPLVPPSAAPAEPSPGVSDLQLMMRELAPSDVSLSQDLAAVAECPPPASYYTLVPPAPGTHQGQEVGLVLRSRHWDGPHLREMRKRIESTTMSQDDIDAQIQEIIDDAAVLASDYIGNTIIQKLYEQATPAGKMALLERIAPHLASIGIHKNGTWAAQKLIDLASTPEEITLICRHLKPFVPPLLLDQFGNYVVGATLKFGSPASDMVFDAMFNRCWEIGQGRFGARSMRTCLESPHTTRLQQKRIAIAIIHNAIPLATSANGALLLTWLLDMSNLPGRYRLLAPRFAPHLPHLCTHKLASTTVLRLINQKVDSEASRLLVDNLFEHSPQTLEDILGDQVQGINFVQKVMASPTLETAKRQICQRLVESIVRKLQLEEVPAYAQLLQTLANGPSQNASPGPPPVRPPRQTSPFGHAHVHHPGTSPVPLPGHPAWIHPGHAGPTFFPPHLQGPYAASSRPAQHLSHPPSDGYGAVPYYSSAPPADVLPTPHMSPATPHYMRRGPDMGSPSVAGFFGDYAMPWTPPLYAPPTQQ